MQSNLQKKREEIEEGIVKKGRRSLHRIIFGGGGKVTVPVVEKEELSPSVVHDRRERERLLVRKSIERKERRQGIRQN